MKQRQHLFLAGLTASILLTSGLEAQTYTSVSRSTSGTVGDGHSGEPRISGDGRYVAFASKASNLTVAGSTNGFYDIYLRDTELDITTRISMGAGGFEPDGDSRWPEISEDGSYIIFSSAATNIVGGDTNFSADMFFHTVATGLTERVSLSWLGAQTSGGVQMDDRRYDLSDDGRYVVFTSTANDYVTIMTSNATRNVYLRDRIAGTTTLVSYKLGGTGSSGGYAPSIDADGTSVVFVSNDHLFVTDDADSNDDVFLHDVATGVVSLISYGTSGMSGSSPGHSTLPRITPDGLFVLFQSTCSDIVAEDATTGSDIFLRDLTTGITEVVSYNQDDEIEMFTYAIDADLSSDARYIVFSGREKTHAPTPFVGLNIYLRDRTLGTTELVSNPRWWFAIVMKTAGAPQVTNSADAIVFNDPGAGTAEEGTSIFSQVNHRARIAGSGTMSLINDGAAPVGSTFSISGYDGPPTSTCYVLYSANTAGTLFAGHTFDVGSPVSILGSGTTDSDGTFLWTSPVIPPSASGRIINIELAATDGTDWYDSNWVEFEVL